MSVNELVNNSSLENILLGDKSVVTEKKNDNLNKENEKVKTISDKINIEKSIKSEDKIWVYKTPFIPLSFDKEREFNIKKEDKKNTKQDKKIIISIEVNIGVGKITFIRLLI